MTHTPRVFRDFFFEPVSYPERVHVEITNKCHLKCQHCSRITFGRGELKNITIERFEDILQSLDDVHHRFILVGWGEPLIHPQLPQLIKLAKTMGSVDITTSGTNLSEKRAIELADVEVDRVSFSIDTLSDSPYGHPYTDTFEKLEMFINVCREHAHECKVRVVTVLMDNCGEDIRGIIHRAGKLGLDEVFLLRLVRTHAATRLQRPNWNEEMRIYAEAMEIGKSYGMSVKNHWFTHTGLRGALQRLIRPYQFGRDRYCYLTRNTVYIRQDGKVTPCSALPNYVIGDITKQSVREIWEAESFNSFRKAQDKLCGNCDFAKFLHRV